jgi:hypothetical protein
MGKALLVMVLGTGLFISVGYMGMNEARVQTTDRQASYEEEVIAREIARSGYNAAMGIIRPHGSRVLDASAAVNGSQASIASRRTPAPGSASSSFPQGTTAAAGRTGSTSAGRSTPCARTTSSL